MSVWDVASGKLLQTLSGHKGGVGSLAWSPDQRAHINDSDFSLVRTYNELRTVSTTGLRERDYER